MSNFDRRDFVKVTGGLGVAGLTGLAGCSGGPSGDGGGSETTTGGETSDGETTTAADAAANIGLVYGTGGTGDGSFNDQAKQGIEQAVEELDVAYQSAEPDEVSQFSNYQQQFASSTDPNYDLVSCIGYLQADALSESASQYPDQQFQIVDSTVEGDNVASYVFQEHEGSFLTGVLAGKLTTMSFEAGAGATQSDSTNVGFVGGVEGDLIGKFEAGYKAGVKYANDDVDIQTSYVGSFNDPSGGQEAALAMYNSGADIVYHASGNTGTGVFQAAQQKGRFAIGVDRDQSLTKPSYADVILASMVKRVDTAVYNCVKNVVDESFDGGSTTTLGLQDGGVACVYGDELGGDVPEDVKTAVADARQAIIDGDIDVPTDPNDA
ncbi:BMP family ABC transporter substrate-binding protein [Halarchaeum grantii]|uniref:BMP family ABC transporter substrate-binding protein n=1 Tax=Halarchaeum grantii TaxID=1193105 RepID=A0A830ET53_9EURY|nr:BMP family protein [Halarchaeum grantii]GGL22360.1 BMP family ABC transporter substrate-binding protein [Halarchaeum grantii]